MQTIRVQTTQNVFIHYPVASVGDRILAFIIDRIILVIYTVAIVAWMLNFNVEIPWLWITLLGFPWFFYHLVFEIFMNGQTPGKTGYVYPGSAYGRHVALGRQLHIALACRLYRLLCVLGYRGRDRCGHQRRGQRLGDLTAGISGKANTPGADHRARYFCNSRRLVHAYLFAGDAAFLAGYRAD